MTKTLSYPREVAESLLAECLHSPEAVLAALRDLRPEVFEDQEHRALWRAIVTVFESAGTVDPELVGDHLARTGQLEAVGGVDSLTALAERVPYAAHFRRHAEVLTDYNNKKALHKALMTRAEYALDPTVSYDDAREFAYLPDSLTGGGKRSGLFDNRITAADLIAQYPLPRPFVIEGLFRAGQVATAVNASKSGKSWMMLQLALSVASGRDFLGMRTSPGPVVLIDLELQAEDLSFRLATVARAMGLSESVLKDVEPHHVRGKGATVDDIAGAAHQWKGVKVILVDPLYKTLGDADENSNSDMARVFDALAKTAEDSGAAVLVTHHQSKGGQSQKSVTDTGSGAGSISRASDLHFILRPHTVPGVSVVQAAVRSFAPLEP
ncbi:MAG: AAA family ATPase, partial [Planctomycetaceae bacterium]